MKRNKEKKNGQNPTGVCLGRFQSVRRYLSVVCCYCPQRNPLGSSVHSRVDNCIVGNVKRKVITQNEEKSRVVVRCETAVLLVIGVSICVHHSGEGKRKANLFQTAQHSPRAGRVRFIAHNYTYLLCNFRSSHCV